MISSPGGVTLSSLPPRSESFTSSSSSSFLIATLSVGQETKQALAARPECFSHATATMYFSLVRDITAAFRWPTNRCNATPLARWC
jgi:hypothetical protein